MRFLAARVGLVIVLAIALINSVGSLLFVTELLFLAIAFVGFIQLMAAARGRGTYLGERGASLVAVVVAAWALGHLVHNAQVGVSKNRGDEIVVALRAFQEQVGQFPDSLEQLVPVYLQAVPSPSVGFLPVAFNYSTHEEHGFRLGFPSLGWGFCERWNHHDGWYCD